MADYLTSEQRRKNMRAVKSRGSKIEQLMAKALWSEGFRYRRNNRSIFGNPDFTLRSLKIAIFVDSEFWHGKDWEIHQHDHKSNREFWIGKIEKNIARDKKVNIELSRQGWEIVRFWGKEIHQDLDTCIDKVKRIVANAKR